MQGACGSSDLRAKRGNGGAPEMITIPIGKGKPGALDTLVCVSCGHVEMSIGDSDSVARIASTWDRP